MAVLNPASFVNDPYRFNPVKQNQVQTKQPVTPLQDFPLKEEEIRRVVFSIIGDIPNSGDYILSSSNGNVSWSDDITLTKLTIGDTVITDGDIDLGDDGTIEIGDGGSITVGESTISTGDLDLGSSGTIETDSVSATGDINCDTFEASDAEVDSIEVSGGATIGSDLSVGGNIDCASLSADDITYAGTDLDAYIDDSIQNAIDSLTGSGTLDCDTKEVTITFTT